MYILASLAHIIAVTLRYSCILLGLFLLILLVYFPCVIGILLLALAVCTDLLDGTGINWFFVWGLASGIWMVLMGMWGWDSYCKERGRVDERHLQYIKERAEKRRRNVAQAYQEYFLRNEQRSLNYDNQAMLLLEYKK